MYHLMVVYTHAPPYGGLYTCTTLWWSIHMYHLMVVYTHAPPYGGLYTCTTLWWSIHMHHLMVVYTHVPPYGGIHMHHLMAVYTHAPPYGGLYTCRAAKSPAFAGDLPVFVFLGAYLPSSRLDTSISRICMAYLQRFSLQFS